MPLINFLRFRKKAPDKGPPPKNFVDVDYDPTVGKMVAMDSDGNPVLFDAAGGAVSTADLTTSDGSAAAAAGKLGEYISDDKSLGSAVLLTGSDSVLQINLTPGDWDVQASLGLVFDAATVTSINSRLQTSPGVITNSSTVVREHYNTTTSTENHNQVHAPRRISVASNTTIYLAVIASIGAGTVSGFGFLSARRVR